MFVVFFLNAKISLWVNTACVGSFDREVLK